ncbi:MAG: hypothetical protein EBU90_14065 [Proteobacteria bacterium]|nr:hypothetical protein [Pseudomonadota bacterium]
MNKPDRFYTFNRKLYMNYKMSPFVSPDGKYNGWEEWSVFCGLDDRTEAGKIRWFQVDDFYYDGMTVSSVTICGVVFGKMYSYVFE